MGLPTCTLNNGGGIPMIGLGTWRSTPDVVAQAVKDAIAVGYRHIDCAHSYVNETEVGAAIEEMLAQNAIQRSDLFVTSKLWNTYHRPEWVRRACEASLRKLRLDYLDLYLIHWPTAYRAGDEIYPKDEAGNVVFDAVDIADTWAAMEQLVEDGLCRSIGLSNFNRRQIERILNRARIPPAVLQVECHPYLNQERLIAYCRSKDICVTAYSPLGSGHTPYKKPGDVTLLEHPQIKAIAEQHQRSPAQVLLRFHIQRGVTVISRSVNKEHMAANLAVFDFQLRPEDMTALTALDFNGRFMFLDSAAGHPEHPFENDEF